MVRDAQAYTSALVLSLYYLRNYTRNVLRESLWEDILHVQHKHAMPLTRCPLGICR